MSFDEEAFRKSKEDSERRVAKAHSLRDQLEKCTSIEEHFRITSEYEKVMGFPMMVPVDQYNDLLNRATPEEIERLWKERS